VDVGRADPVDNGDSSPSPLRCVTDDIDEFAANLNSVFYPAKIRVASQESGHPPAELAAVRLNHLTIARARFGTAVEVDPGDLGSYHVNVPLAGTVISRCGDQETIASPLRATVFTPGEHTVLPLWHADATQICIKINRSQLEQELARIAGRPIDTRIRFVLGMDLTTSRARRWLSMVKILLEAIDDKPAATASGLTAQVDYLERAVIAGLIVNQPHSMSAELCAPTRHTLRGLQEVLDYIESRPGAQFTVGDLAAAAGVSARRLDQMFRARFDMSPMVYVRHVRLDGVRADLLGIGDGVTVSDVAFRWGFNHLGRFAAHYRRKFGELPSQTLGAHHAAR